jgi:DNA-binding CsgD family transcriptional regulator
MDSLEELWPDPDRRADALQAITARIEGRRPFPQRGGQRGKLALTPVEIRCLQAASFGLQMTEAAAAFGMGYETVQTHLKYARRKLRAKNTTHACCEAIRRGLIS